MKRSKRTREERVLERRLKQGTKKKVKRTIAQKSKEIEEDDVSSTINKEAEVQEKTRQNNNRKKGKREDLNEERILGDGKDLVPKRSSENYQSCSGSYTATDDTETELVVTQYEKGLKSKNDFTDKKNLMKKKTGKENILN